MLFLSCIKYSSAASTLPPSSDSDSVRQRLRLHDGWRFWRSETTPDKIIYERRPDANGDDLLELKPWIQPSGNSFIKNEEERHVRPSKQPEVNVTFASPEFDDNNWESVTVPHDWAIRLPFIRSSSPIPPSMGQLPVHGVGWYRRIFIAESDFREKTHYLDVDGGMAYPMVWVNGHLVGGWPFGYNSFRLDISEWLVKGRNSIAIRVENPTGQSSRWYPGAGLYRNVWLTTVGPTHVSQWGTFVTCRDVSEHKATVDVSAKVQTNEDIEKDISIVTEIFETDAKTHQRQRKSITKTSSQRFRLSSGSQKTMNNSVTIDRPSLWGPPPTQRPNLYVAVTSLYSGDGSQLLDTYETEFGIRSLKFNSDKGLLVNGKKVFLHGVNQHDDQGAIGAAYNKRATKRQLEMLQELGANAIRLSHNPPAPELLRLTDRMGFLVINEIFDSWRKGKNELDFHLIFDDWHEPDLRSFIRRDRNHPSVIVWSYGNEVVEQESDDEGGAKISLELRAICEEEDPTRPSSVALQFSQPNSAIAKTMDIISLNYQGEGMRYGPAYDYLTTGNKKTPQYTHYHDAFPEKLILGSEVASSLSLRGSYSFPVTPYNSAPVNASSGAVSPGSGISAYELYTADAGSSADRVFDTQDSHAFVSGGFVWTGWDYIGEPYYFKSVRSGYWGIIDLAGFKKERFWLYQSRWRPDLKMAHIVPHWNWPDRVGKVTPVHVFSSADMAELFINGKSQGYRKKDLDEGFYRFRWDKAEYQPGEVRVVTYKNGKQWATDMVETTGNVTALRVKSDRSHIMGDGEDLSFLTVEVVDEKGRVIPTADNMISFSITSGLGEIVATDNGFPNDFTAFSSSERKACHGLLLGIMRAKSGFTGSITIETKSEGLKSAEIPLEAE